MCNEKCKSGRQARDHLSKNSTRSMSSVRNSSIRTSRSTCAMRAPYQRRERNWQFCTNNGAIRVAAPSPWTATEGCIKLS